jgi:hypothetical protein
LFCRVTQTKYKMAFLSDICFMQVVSVRISFVWWPKFCDFQLEKKGKFKIFVKKNEVPTFFFFIFTDVFISFGVAVGKKRNWNIFKNKSLVYYLDHVKIVFSGNFYTEKIYKNNALRFQKSFKLITFSYL